MKHLFSIVFILVSTFIATAQKVINNKFTERHVMLPASHIALLPIENEDFTASRVPRGFFNKEKNIGIAVSELNTQFIEDEDGEKAMIAKLGVLKEYEKYLLNNLKASYKVYEIRDEKGNTQTVARLDIKGENKVYAIIGTFPSNEDEKYRKIFEYSIFSVVIDETTKIDPLEGFPFILNLDNTEFKPEEGNSFGEGLSLTPDGRNIETTGEITRLTLVPQIVNEHYSSDDLKKYFESDFLKTSDGSVLKMEGSNPLNINGIEGFEAFGFNVTENQSTPFYGAVLLSNGVLLSIKGISLDESTVRRMSEVLKVIKMQ